MSQNSVTTFESGGAVTLYDRFADLYDITFKFNRYSHSIERYLRERALPLPEDANVLDAGCGTGLLTLAILRTLRRPARVTAFDLSAPSLVKAHKAVVKLPESKRHRVRFVQANLLALPFADETFDFVATSGALMFRFKTHEPAEIERHTRRHFRLLERHRFQPHEPIGWTKEALLAQKTA